MPRRNRTDPKAAPEHGGTLCWSSFLMLLLSGLVLSVLMQSLQQFYGKASPLEPLSAAEINTVSKVLRLHQKATPDTLFSLITLNEPDKSQVYQGKSSDRHARVVLYERATHQTSEAVIDLQHSKVVSFKTLDAPENVQPGPMLAEFQQAVELVRQDPRWQQAMRRRGLSLDQVAPDAAVGQPEPGEMGRFLYVATYLKGVAWNSYARPVEGVLARVDVAAGKVVSFTDTGNVPVSSKPGAGLPRTLNFSPVAHDQPLKTPFTLRGHQVLWDRWKLSYSLNAREGLVIHQAGWMEGRTFRPILYRGSLSEMVIPYGDPDPNHRWRQPIDVAEYGLGLNASPLVRGGDVPEDALLMDEVLFTQWGAPKRMHRAIALYERDGGVLFRHMDPASGRTVSVRGRELCLSTISTLGNYDYQLTWVFTQSGIIRVEVGLTGIMVAKGIPASTDHAATHTGHRVDDHLQALHHQHIFGFRLDVDVGGRQNTPYEMNTLAPPTSEQNPVGNAMQTIKTVISSEADGVRDASRTSGRFWGVDSTHPDGLGGQTGYALIPGKSTLLIAAPDARLRTRAPFIEHDLWITRHHPEERYAAGESPTNNPDPGGVQAYQANRERLENQDVVLWYSLGVTHIPRPEEWPIMHAHTMGFSLEPVGFFRQNPALK